MRIFLIDDHPLYRAGVKALLEDNKTLDVYEFASAAEGLVAQTKTPPSIIFLDVGLPDISGLQALNLFIKADPTCKVFMLSTHNQSIYVEHAQEGGAAGYILKDDSPEIILDCLNISNSENFYLSPNCRRAAKITADDENKILTRLSMRELEVLHYLRQDFTSREIGDLLGLSYRTVQNHRANIKAKLDLTRNSELVKIASVNKRLLDNIFNKS